MSEELKEQKERDIEELNRRIEDEKKAVAGDSCTHCGAPTLTFPYNDFFVMPKNPMFGWLECPFCGQVFCPKSIRDKKMVIYGLKEDKKVIV